MFVRNAQIGKTILPASLAWKGSYAAFVDIVTILTLT